MIVRIILRKTGDLNNNGSLYLQLEISPMERLKCYNEETSADDNVHANKMLENIDEKAKKY
jgi:hypothetical protein